MKSKMRLGGIAAGALAMASIASFASSHREAPFITKNPKVDSTDFYMFRSYETGRAAFTTFIANYQPFQDPMGGPNYFSMDPEALYEIHIDNNNDAMEDLTFQFRFNNTLANSNNGVALPISKGDGGTVDVAIPLINAGVITAADQSKLNLAETYTVKVVRNNRRTGTAEDVTNAAGGSKVFTKPVDFIGAKSFSSLTAPDRAAAVTAYAAYANQYIYNVNIPGCATPGKVFVGQRAESFAVNLGTVFDLVDAPAGVITNNAQRNAVPNPMADKSITSIAVEVPTTCLVQGTQKIIGGWQTASVRQARVINPAATYARPSREGGAWVQVSRLGMPLVNEIVIGLKDKDRWNSSEPKDDTQFLTYVTNPTLPALIEVLFGPTVKAPTKFPRADLVAAFLTGVPNVNANGATAEYVRLNTDLPATAAGSQNPLGAAGCFVNGVLNTMAAGCDVAGFPNGRRPIDDVVDIELRVAMGYLYTNDTDAPSRNVAFHDAVAQEGVTFATTFPYVGAPKPGANGDGTSTP
ncbi:MAG: DUF4331 domain-containing protein [Myxococcaceae bacterium]